MNGYIIAKIVMHFFIVSIIGYISLKIINSAMRLNAKTFALLYGLGAALITLEMLIISLLGLKFSLGLILLPWALPLLLVFFKKRKESKNYLNIQKLYFKIIDKVKDSNPLVLLLFIAVIFPFFLKLLLGLPLIGWDAWMHWGFKAKIFYFEKSVPLELYTGNCPIMTLGQREYPLLVSLIETFFYECVGIFDDSLARVIFFCFYLSLLVFFYNLLKSIYTKLYAGIITFFLATIPFITDCASGYYSGYADLIFMYYNFISVALLWSWSIEKKNWQFYLASAFTGFAFWTKVDGIVLVIANFILILFLILFDKETRALLKIKLFLSYALIVSAIAGPWYSVVFFLRLPSGHIAEKSAMSAGEFFKRLPVFATGVVREALNFPKWNILWVTFALVLIFCFARMFNKTNRIFFISFLIQAGLYSLVTLFHSAFYHTVANFLDRLMLHLVPLILIITANSLYQKNRMILGAGSQ
ncbi:MAG: hypothetical protein V1739_06410 [Candidatus Omnitrophota bacterium]